MFETTATWAVFPVLFILFGAIFNVYQFVVHVASSMKYENIYIFFVVLVLMDCLALLSSLLDDWLQIALDVHLRDLSVVACRLHMWISGVTQDVPPWILVITTYEKRAFLWYPVPADSQFPRQTAKTVVLGLILLFCLRNVDVAAYSLVRIESDATNGSVTCALGQDSSAIFLNLLTPWLDVLLRVVSPFVCLATYNVFIMRKLQREKYCAQRLMSKIGIVAPYWFYSGLQEARHTVRRTASLTVIMFACGLPYSVYVVLRSLQVNGRPSDFSPKLKLASSVLYYLNYACIYAAFAVQDSRLLLTLRDTWRNPLARKRGTNVASSPPRIMPVQCTSDKAGLLARLLPRPVDSTNKVCQESAAEWAGALGYEDNPYQATFPLPGAGGRYKTRRDSGFVGNEQRLMAEKPVPESRSYHREFLIPVM